MLQVLVHLFNLTSSLGPVCFLRGSSGGPSERFPRFDRSPIILSSARLPYGRSKGNSGSRRKLESKSNSVGYNREWEMDNRLIHYTVNHFSDDTLIDLRMLAQHREVVLYKSFIFDTGQCSCRGLKFIRPLLCHSLGVLRFRIGSQSCEILARPPRPSHTQ